MIKAMTHQTGKENDSNIVEVLEKPSVDAILMGILSRFGRDIWVTITMNLHHQDAAPPCK